MDRATLHNADVIKRKGVLTGDMVILRNAGELAEPLAVAGHGDATVGQVDVVQREINARGKIGVSMRAAATLFAMLHGLTAGGQLPMARTRDRP